MGGIKHLSKSIISDLRERLPKQRKTQREAIGTLVATMLEVRSANSNDLAAALPREAERQDMRYQWVSRVLSNPHIKSEEVMEGYSKELFQKLRTSKKTIVLMMDQSQVNEEHELLMVSVRVGRRALPVLWRVEKTAGEIGFREQKKLLKQVLALVGQERPIVLMADRFYGTAQLILWCQEQGWDYRIRLKGNLWVDLGSCEKKTGELAVGNYEQVQLTNQAIDTNIGVIQDSGFDEPWIIAMGSKPSEYKTLDYGMRWGIESMFSDFKSRGFGLCETQLRYRDRIERLILIMTIALYWATSTGMWDERNNRLPYEKKVRKAG